MSDISTTSTSHARSRPTGTATAAADLAYGAFYGGALGGSVIAIFFLIMDGIQGQALYTPSMLGTALFLDTIVPGVRLDMVALFSVVHFASYFAVGAFASWLHLTWEPLRHQFLALGVVIFTMLTGLLFLADWLVLDGVASALGIFEVLIANAITAGAMAAFIGRALPGEREPSPEEA
ncbi:MAG TPA: hypothetical protein VMM35_11220 [Longimicrobiales bacterium]|nr:hypothetical protein [Longimicrobiales bacterium]